MSRLARAWSLYELERFDSAIRVCRDVLRYAPGDAEATALLSLCLVETGRPEEARTAATDAVSLNPHLPLARSALVQAHLSIEDVPAARSAAEEWLRLAPQSADALRTRAWISYLEGDNPTASLLLDQALAVDPDFQDAKLLRTLVLSSAGQTGEALAAADDGLRDAPDDAEAHSAKGIVYMEASNIRFAELAFREALRIQPDNEHAQAGLKETLRRRFPPYRWLCREPGHDAKNIPQWVGPVALIGLSCLFAAVVFRLVPAKLTTSVTLLPFWLIQAMPVAANASLLFHPLGRLVLSRAEKIEAAGLVAVLALCITGLVLMRPLGLPEWSAGLPFLTASMFAFGRTAPVSERGRVAGSLIATAASSAGLIVGFLVSRT